MVAVVNSGLGFEVVIDFDSVEKEQEVQRLSVLLLKKTAAVDWVQVDYTYCL